MSSTTLSPPPSSTPSSPSPSSSSSSSSVATGLESYYRSKVDSLHVTLIDKHHDLSRLEAQRNDLNSKVRKLRDELSRLQEPGSSIGEVIKVMGKDKILVKVQPDGKFIVKANADIDMNSLAAGTRVALRSDSYVLHKILPTKVDPLVSLMRVEAVPDATYDMVGGLEKQVKEMKEVIELPIKHPELFESLGISQPKGVIMFGPPGTGKTLLARAVAHHTECFPSEDTRVLTDRGFLFLDQIRSIVEGDDKLLFAAYDKETNQIVYQKGTLIIKENWKGKIVDITQGHEKRRWVDGGADQYGNVRGNSNSNFLSLRTTANHQLYVQQGNEGSDGNLWYPTDSDGGKPVKNPHAKVLAGDLTCDCEKGKCTHAIRMLAVAENGVRASSDDKPWESLGLPKDTQSIFFELLGFWLGDVSMHYESPSAQSNQPAVRFSQTKVEDIKYLLHSLATLGLVKNIDYLVEGSTTDIALCLNTEGKGKGKVTGKEVTIRIVTPSWVKFFDDEFSSHRVKDQTTLDMAWAKSAKRIPRWALFTLTKVEIGLLIRGLQMADGSWATGANIINTSSVSFRDQLVQLLLHGGYTAHFTLSSTAGTMRRKANEEEGLRQIKSTEENWSVFWSSPTSAPAKTAAWPHLKRGDLVHENYSGTVWCVGVQHSDHLLFAQRALRTNGVVTKASRPVIVGNCEFIRVSGSELVQKYIGEGSRMVRELFVMARQHAPSIIFMDEIDSIGGTRIDSSSGGDSEVQRTMLELLNQLDGFEPSQQIKVLMATNRMDILDPALLRPGRIDRKIEFPNPNEAARLQILKIHSRKMNLMRGINLRSIANKMKGASGAESKAVCTEAGMFALRERRIHVTQEDFEMAVTKVMKKDSDKDMSQQQFWK